MSLLRIRDVKVLSGFTLQLTLTDGSTIQKDVSELLKGPMFEALRNDPSEFGNVHVENGTLVWPNGADLCPDVLIWNGMPPERC